MYLPKFQYTATLVNNIATVERLYGQLISEKLIPSLAVKLTKENQILATHYSTSIEGNDLDQKEVTNILLGDKIPTSKSELEVKNYFDALNHVSVEAMKKKPVTIDLTLRLHKYVMRGMEIKHPGQLRNGKVIVGHRGTIGLVVKHDPPESTAKGIQKRLEDLYSYLERPSDISPLILSGILHHEIAYIHPFYDGNGRVTRLLTAYYLLIHRYEVTKYFILDDYYDIDRLEYSDKLHSADSGDKTVWLEYYLEGIAHSLHATLERIKDLTQRQLESIEGENRVLVSPREEDVLKIVMDLKKIKTKDVVEHLSVSRQQAHALIHNLVDKGMLLKSGSTKSSYYELK